MLKEIFLIFTLILTLNGQYRDEHSFQRTHIFELNGSKAESLSANEFGNRLLVGGGKSGLISLLDITDLDDISLINNLDMDQEVQYFAEILVTDSGFQPDVLEKIEQIKANVTDVKYLTSGRYAVASISFYSKKLDRHPMLTTGALALIDMESLSVKSMLLTDPNPDNIAISYDNHYILVACEGYYDTYQSNLSVTGSVMRFEMSGANVVPSGRFTFPEDVVCDLRKSTACPLGDILIKPEYIDASPHDLTAVVSVQESNILMFLNIEDGIVTLIKDLGYSEHCADTDDDKTIAFHKTAKLRLEPDGVIYTPDGRHIISANEGRMVKGNLNELYFAGGRNISAFDLTGKVVYDSLHLTEANEAISGIYNDKHSDSHGSQLEALATGQVDDTLYLAASAERSNAIHFFDITDMDRISYLGHELTGGKSPEGIIYVPEHKAFICANEKSESISVFQPIDDWTLKAE